MRRSSPLPRVRVASAAAYELVLSVAVAASSATTPEARAVRRAAGDELVARVRGFAASDWMWAHVLSLALDAPPPRDAAALLVAIERMPAREILRRLAGYYVHWFQRLTPLAVMDAAIGGDPRAIGAFVDHGYGEDASWSRSLRTRLDAGAARTKSDLIDVLDAWSHAVGREIAPTLRHVARAATERRRALAASPRVEAPGITDLVLIPSRVIRPVRHEFEHGTTKIVCFPVDPREDGVPAPSAELLAVSHALADESRLRVLMALMGSDMAAQELADRLGLGLSTVLHHLGELRAAGLVAHGGRRRPYRIDRRGVARAAAAISGIGTRRTTSG